MIFKASVDKVARLFGVDFLLPVSKWPCLLSQVAHIQLITTSGIIFVYSLYAFSAAGIVFRLESARY